MTDTNCELLILAAYAAGYELGQITAEYDGTGIWAKVDGAWRWWYPRTNDGDALRLAVKLHIDILFFRARVSAWAQGRDDGMREDFGDDPDAATRLAIVRAAAEIGRKK